MARRSQAHRSAIPGYDDLRPSRDDRKREHRRVRHEAQQLLRTIDDPEEFRPLPRVKGDRHHDHRTTDPNDPVPRRFKVWKTKFWKRRDSYLAMKAAIDARWEEATAEEEEDW